jgi:hypothetical protein
MAYYSYVHMLFTLYMHGRKIVRFLQTSAVTALLVAAAAAFYLSSEPMPPFFDLDAPGRYWHPEGRARYQTGPSTEEVLARCGEPQDSIESGDPRESAR